MIITIVVFFFSPQYIKTLLTILLDVLPTEKHLQIKWLWHDHQIVRSQVSQCSYFFFSCLVRRRTTDIFFSLITDDLGFWLFRVELNKNGNNEC
jgi:hypothetical protein